MFRLHGKLPRVFASALIGSSLALGVYFVRTSSPRPVSAARIDVPCERATRSESELTSRYFYNPSYGWFDRTHFKAGNPAQVIADVRAAVEAGGGTVTVAQNVHDGAAGYSATYTISADVTPQNDMAVALGIYKDWSYRFESWQGELPQRLAGMLSPFAVEDLPSHYVGFYAAAHHLEPFDVFACYMPGTEQTGDSPPRFTGSQLMATSDDDVGLNTPLRLVNQEMRPMTLLKSGWENVPWPDEMQMEVIDSASGLWWLAIDETWYLDEAHQLSPPVPSLIGPYDSILE